MNITKRNFSKIYKEIKKFAKNLNEIRDDKKLKKIKQDQEIKTFKALGHLDEIEKYYKDLLAEPVKLALAVYKQTWHYLDDDLINSIIADSNFVFRKKLKDYEYLVKLKTIKNIEMLIDEIHKQVFVLLRDIAENNLQRLQIETYFYTKYIMLYLAVKRNNLEEDMLMAYERLKEKEKNKIDESDDIDIQDIELEVI